MFSTAISAGGLGRLGTTRAGESDSWTLINGDTRSLGRMDES